MTHDALTGGSIDYDPNCAECRQMAGRLNAGVTRQCEAHARRELAALRAEVERLHAYLPLARAAVDLGYIDFGNPREIDAYAELLDAIDALTLEQRAWLMEDK